MFGYGFWSQSTVYGLDGSAAEDLAFWVPSSGVSPAITCLGGDILSSMASVKKCFPVYVIGNTHPRGIHHVKRVQDQGVWPQILVFFLRTFTCLTY